MGVFDVTDAGPRLIAPDPGGAQRAIYPKIRLGSSTARLLSACFRWRPQGESNPRRRRERARTYPITTPLSRTAPDLIRRCRLGPML